MADRRVRTRHVVVPMAFDERLCERPAHRQPHYHFDAFRSGLAKILHVFNSRRPLGLVHQQVQESAIPLTIDQSGARPLELMGHAPGAPHLHGYILVETLHRTRDRPTEREAAAPAAAPPGV